MTMIFRPECHGFHKSAFVVVIKGYNFLCFDVSWWLSYKVSGHHLSSPPLPSHLILSLMKSNILVRLASIAVGDHWSF